MDTLERVHLTREVATSADGSGQATADPLREAMRGAQLARVLAQTNRHLADLTERRARRMTGNWAMHQSAVRRMRIQAAANEAEARRYERLLAQLRGLDVDQTV